MVLPDDDDDALRAFDSTWLLRRILSAERRIVADGGQLCFLRIQPDRVIFTYGIGTTLWDNVRHPRRAIGRERIPDNRLPRVTEGWPD
jgi:hypothetical protein